MRLKLALVGAAALALSGCSMFSDEEPTYAELDSEFTGSVGMRVVWEEEVGDGVGGYFSRLNPVRFGDNLIVADREGVVSALAIADGREVWSVDLTDEDSGWSIPGGADSARIAGGLVERYGRIYFGTENGEVGALSAADGSVEWQRDVGGEVIADPAVGDGLVVVHTSAGNVLGLDAETGEQRWSLVGEVPALSVRGGSAPLIANGGSIVGSEDGKLRVVINDNGQLAWEAVIARPAGTTEFERLVDVDAEPVVYGTNLYTIGFNGQLSAVEFQSGRVLWQRDYRGYQNLTVTALAIYLTDKQGHVYSVARESGAEIWSNTSLWGRQLTAPVVVSDFIVVGDFEGYLHVLSRSSGAVVGRIELDGDGAYVEPLVIDGELFVQLRDGTVARVELAI